MTLYKKLSQVVLLSVSTLFGTSLSFADAIAQSPLLYPGVYSNGYHYLKISQVGDRVCIQGFIDADKLLMTYEDAKKQLQQEREEGTTALLNRLEEELMEQRIRLQALIQDEELLNDAVQNGSLPSGLLGVVSNPQALEQFLVEREEASRQQIIEFVEILYLAAEEELNEAYTSAYAGSFKGIVSAKLAPQNSSIDVLSGTRFRMIPQASMRILFGEKENLRSYFSQEASLPLNIDIVDCLMSQKSFIQNF